MFKVLTKGCEPTRGSKYSAAVDLYASEDCIIAAGETKIIGLGVAIDIQKFTSDIAEAYKNDGIEAVLDKLENFKLSHCLELHPRSSLRSKGLISNTGIIDLDYEDEIKIIIHNSENGSIEVNRSGFDSWGSYRIEKGDKIAQILLKEHKSYLFGIESDEDRTGGFGSTGK